MQRSFAFFCSFALRVVLVANIHQASLAQSAPSSTLATTPTSPGPPTTNTTNPPPSPAPADQGSAPPILVAPSENSLTYILLVPGPTAPTADDLKAGQLVSVDQPTLQVLPTLTAEPAVRNGNSWNVLIKLSGLIPFGNSTIPIFNRKIKIETLHIVKTGLTVEAPAVAQLTGEPLLLLLRNPADFQYTRVRARLRFKEKDVCTFAVERFPDQKAAGLAGAPKAASTNRGQKAPSSPLPTVPSITQPSTDCDDIDSWTEFQIPRYSGVSLRAADLPSTWFDAADGYSRAVPTKGTLTLRFSGGNSAAQDLEEQVIPVQVSFQPGTATRSLGYIRVFFWLLAGALCSLGLRVAIPNYRRVRSLTDQLDATRKNIRGISDEVDSMLRVQLMVENMGLYTLSRSVLFISPGFAEIALRTETAIATLCRRIDYVRRLDAALNRRRLLIADELAQPTRIAAIDRNLNTASEELKSDQFREQDWVFIQQALESADKIIGNPTEEDKSTFETVLVQRWKSIATQYGFLPDKGWTNIPDSLMPMEICFPSPDILCPQGASRTDRSDPTAAKEADASQWIKTAGTVRADLQLTALELIREFQFLAPAIITGHWGEAMASLTPWLATPAFEHLNNARSLLRQLAEGISPDDVVGALQRCEAHIELDPQEVAFGERVHLSVRFWQSNWNSAAARQEIVCEWRFKAVDGKTQSGTPEARPESEGSFEASIPDKNQAKSPSAQSAQLSAPAQPLFYREKGWEINHYFADAGGRSPLQVQFYYQGKPVPKTPQSADPLIYPFVIPLKTESRRTAYWEQTKRVAFESIELIAALLVPLCALAISTADKGSSSQWWQLLGLGFGSDTIRNVLSASSNSKPAKTP